MRNKILTAFVVIATMVALSVTLWTSYQTGKRTDCQTALNAVFLETLRGRAAINDGDRKAIRDLVETVSEAQTQEDVEQAFDEFDKAQVAQDKLRKEFVYPDVTKCN